MTDGFKDRIFLEDCIEGMKRIPDGSVDMILTDPPFGTTDNFWDKCLPMSEMWEQFNRVTKVNAAIVIFAQLPFAVDVINANRKMFRYEWVWQKPMPVGFLNAQKMPMRCHENILVFYRKLPTYNPQWMYGKPYTKIADKYWNCYGKAKWKGDVVTKSADGRRYPRDVLTFNNWDFGKRDHPTGKPVDLLEYLIKTYTNEGELVLDACMGSGSTAVAAVNTGRYFVGFETYDKYYEVALRRIEEARNGGSKETVKEENSEGVMGYDLFREMYGRQGAAGVSCQDQTQGFDSISLGQI